MAMMKLGTLYFKMKKRSLNKLIIQNIPCQSIDRVSSLKGTKLVCTDFYLIINQVLF